MSKKAGGGKGGGRRRRTSSSGSLSEDDVFVITEVQGTLLLDLSGYLLCILPSLAGMVMVHNAILAASRRNSVQGRRRKQASLISRTRNRRTRKRRSEKTAAIVIKVERIAQTAVHLPLEGRRDEGVAPGPTV